MKIKIASLCFCMISYFWIGYNFNNDFKINSTTCIFKNVTGFPCPSCGTTRATIQVFQGNIISSILLNPLGLVVSFMLIFVPLLIIIDVFFKGNSFEKSFQFILKRLEKKEVLIFLAVILIINWIWNFNKNL